MKCNFSSAHLHEWYVFEKLSICRLSMYNFTRIRCKTNMLGLSIIPAWRQSDQPGLRQPPKGVNYNLFSPHLDKLYNVGELSIREAPLCNFSGIGHKIKKLRLWKVLARKLRKTSLDDRKSGAFRAIDNFSSVQLHKPYTVGKLSIS